MSKNVSNLCPRMFLKFIQTFSFDFHKTQWQVDSKYQKPYTEIGEIHIV